MFAHLVLLSAAISGLALFTALRRQSPGTHGRLHTLLLTLVAGVGLWALRPSEPGVHFWGVLAIGGTLIVVVAPLVLDQLSRWAFARGHFVAAVRLARVRVILMPGAGLERTLEVVEALAIYERDGLDSALRHLEHLAARRADDGDVALVHEQVVNLLLHGQRWQQGTDYYERHFHRGYAVFRPSLVLGLLRAYAETGDLEAAAGLLRALEKSHAEGRARPIDLVAQAWLTFVAYAGAPRVIDELAAEGSLERIGVSPATAAYLRGVAWDHAGDVERARGALGEVEHLARPTDHSVLAHSREALARLEGEAATRSEDSALDPELARYVSVVAHRLRAAARLRASMPRRPQWWRSAVSASSLVCVGVYVAGLVLDARGADWLELGATAESTWRAGAWWRVFTAPWVHADLLAVVVTLTAAWIAGRGLEQARGSARLLAVLTLAPATGLAVAHAFGVFPMVLGAAGSLLALAMLAGNLAPLTLDAGIARKTRRNLIIAHACLILVTSVAAIPTPLGFDVSPIAWLTTAALAYAGCAFGRSGRVSVSAEQAARLGARDGVEPGSNGARGGGPGRVAAALEGSLAGVAVAVTVGAAGLVGAVDDVEAMQDAAKRPCQSGVVRFDAPPGWIAAPSVAPELGQLFGVPVLEDGVIDGVALRSGQLWMVFAVEASSPISGDEDRSLLVQREPSLTDELAVRARPPSGARLPATIPEADTAQVWSLRRNGELVGVELDWRFAGGVGVGLVVAPGPGGDVATWLGDTPALSEVLTSVRVSPAAEPDAAAGEAWCDAGP